MRLFGREIKISIKALPRSLSAIASSITSGSWQTIWDTTTGAWQQHVEVNRETVVAHATLFACVTTIAADVAKLRIKLMRQDNGIWTETVSPAFSPVLRKPNHFQNRIKFIENWLTSKLLHGNTYVLKQRDERGIVVALYVLDPTRVQPMVTPYGDVYYQLSPDNLANLQDQILVPASEIIHDTMVALFHPLIGVSPIFACGVAATQGLAIQSNSTVFFQNGSRPGGVLTAPGAISTDVAARLKSAWETNYSGANVGKLAVLGDGLKYEQMGVNAVDAQLIEQLKWTDEKVCSCYRVPAYMVGVGQMPNYNNIAALNQQYYSQCLQALIESLELCMDEGLGLDKPKEGIQYGVELDLDGLLRMDPGAQVETLSKGVAGSLMTINDARRRLELPNVPGGDTIWMQQQNYSLAALVERDAKDPFAKPEPAPSVEPPPDPEAAAAKATVATFKAIEAARAEMLA